MRPVVMATRIHPAVSRFTISHPTRLRAASSQTMAISRRLKDFTGRSVLLQSPAISVPRASALQTSDQAVWRSASCEGSFIKAERRFEVLNRQCNQVSGGPVSQLPLLQDYR